MTGEQNDAIIQILRSMNERLGRIEQAVEPEVVSKRLITRRLIVIIAFATLVAIGVYVGFNYLLGNLISFMPDT